MYFLTKLFIEQPLALPGSAKHKNIVMSLCGGAASNRATLSSLVHSSSPMICYPASLKNLDNFNKKT